jgi:hypothetical protein
MGAVARLLRFQRIQVERVVLRSPLAIRQARLVERPQPHRRLPILAPMGQAEVVVQAARSQERRVVLAEPVVLAKNTTLHMVQVVAEVAAAATPQVEQRARAAMVASTEVEVVVAVEQVVRQPGVAAREPQVVYS